MLDYPEHEKLSKISGDSQAIGQFLDFGLPEQHLVLYERFEEPCKCHSCRVGETDGAVGIHCEAHDVRKGTAYYIRYRPTGKHIQTILAEYFEIDQDKIDAEKDEMLVAIRS